MTDREEEALIPLVRNRKSKTKEPTNLSSANSSLVSGNRVSGFEQTIQLTSDHGNKANKRNRRLDKSVKNMFSVRGDNSRQIYILIGIEVRQKSVKYKHIKISIYHKGCGFSHLLCSFVLVLPSPSVVPLPGLYHLIRIIITGLCNST